jgi:uncharacterized damage-inducible protein DinB
MRLDGETRSVLLELLREAFVNERFQGTWFADNKPNSGLLGTLDQLSAHTAASTPIDGANSVMAHAKHLLVSIEGAMSWMEGVDPKTDWEASWKLDATDEESWDDLRKRLRSSYFRLLQTVQEVDEVDRDTYIGMLGTVAHCAYHLGSIRQIAAPQLRTAE